MSSKTTQAADDRNRMSDEVNGVWAEALRQLVSYRYVGSQSVLHDRHNSTGHMTLRSDLRTPAGLLTAPVAIAMLDAAGNNIDRLYHLALTQVDVHLFEAASDVQRLRIISTVLREARTQVFTEARFEDAASGRVIGFGSANWAIINPTPEGFVYTDPGPGVPDNPPMPPLTQAFEAQPRPAGGYVVARLSPRIGTDTLHHGPMLVTLEAASLDVIRAATGSERLRLRTANTRIVRAGRKGPFVTTAELLAISGRTVTARAQMLDEGRNGEVIAVGLIQCELDN